MTGAEQEGDLHFSAEVYNSNDGRGGANGSRPLEPSTLMAVTLISRS